MQTIFRKQGKLFAKKFKASAGLFSESAASDALDSIFSILDADTAKEMRSTILAADTNAMTAGLSTWGTEISFNVGHPEAVAWLESHAAEMVTNINETTRDVIGRIVTQGVDEGWSYGKTAREIKSRYNEFAVGKPQLHIASRAHLVAITEAGESYEEGRYRGAKDLEERGLTMAKSWVTVGDERVTEECLSNESDGWIPIDDSHSSGDEHPLRFPGCLPSGQWVIADDVLGATKRFFNGDLVIITTASGNKLTCTPNHPILTPKGWVGAGRLDIGSDVISAVVCDPAQGTTDMNDQKRPTLIEEVVSTFGSSLEVSSEVVKVSAENFHGDGEGSKVASVWTNSLLGESLNTSVGKHLLKDHLFGSDARLIPFTALSHLAAFFKRVLATCSGFMSGFTISSILFWCTLGHHQAVGFGGTTDININFLKPLRNGPSINIEALGKRVNGFARSITFNQFWNRDRLSQGRSSFLAVPNTLDANRLEAPPDSTLTDVQFPGDICLGSAAQIFADNVIDIQVQGYRGHVYNLQTKQGFYTAEGIITHNCRCDEHYQRAGSVM